MVPRNSPYHLEGWITALRLTNKRCLTFFEIIAVAIVLVFSRIIFWLL